MSGIINEEKGTRDRQADFLFVHNFFFHLKGCKKLLKYLELYWSKKWKYYVK
jgi:hypothetical protein